VHAAIGIVCQCCICKISIDYGEFRGHSKLGATFGLVSVGFWDKISVATWQPCADAAAAAAALGSVQLRE